MAPPSTGTMRPPGGFSASIRAAMTRVAIAAATRWTPRIAARTRRMTDMRERTTRRDIAPIRIAPPAGFARSDVAALDVRLQLVQRLLDGVEMRVDGERMLERLIGALLVAGLAQDHAEPGPGAEMAGVPLQRLGDIRHRPGIVVLEVVERGALVPGLGEIRVE